MYVCSASASASDTSVRSDDHERSTPLRSTATCLAAVRYSMSTVRRGTICRVTIRRIDRRAAGIRIHKKSTALSVGDMVSWSTSCSAALTVMRSHTVERKTSASCAIVATSPPRRKARRNANGILLFGGENENVSLNIWHTSERSCVRACSRQKARKRVSSTVMMPGVHSSIERLTCCRRSDRTVSGSSSVMARSSITNDSAGADDGK